MSYGSARLSCGGNAVCIPPATCENKICRLPSAPDCH
jgi:hypothetical protein